MFLCKYMAVLPAIISLLEGGHPTPLPKVHAHPKIRVFSAIVSAICQQLKIEIVFLLQFVRKPGTIIIGVGAF